MKTTIWTYSEELPYGRDIRDADGLWIGTVNGDHGGERGFPSNDQCLANARLIAAAPKMLHALQLLYEDYDQTYDGEQMSTNEYIGYLLAGQILAKLGENT